MSTNKRYVVGVTPEGRSDILIEDDWRELPEYIPGVVQIRDAWLNHETPANLKADGDPTAGAKLAHEPPDSGAIFRVIKFLPGGTRGITATQVKEAHQQLRSVHVPTADELKKAKDPSMHKTDTLNYFFVASGEMWMLTEGRDVRVKAGDIIVQKGCMHGWRNDGDVPCTLIAVLIDAHPV